MITPFRLGHLHGDLVQTRGTGILRALLVERLQLSFAIRRADGIWYSPGASGFQSRLQSAQVSSVPG